MCALSELGLLIADIYLAINSISGFSFLDKINSNRPVTGNFVDTRETVVPLKKKKFKRPRGTTVSRVVIPEMSKKK